MQVSKNYCLFFTMKEKATISVLNKFNKFMSMTSEKTAALLVKRGRAIQIDKSTIQLLFDKKDWNKLRKEIIKNENRTCYICGKQIPEDEKVTIDHLIPRSRMGKDSKENLHCCCSHCNEDKGNMTIREYYKHIKRNIDKYDYIDLENLKKYTGGGLNENCSIT